MEREDGLQAWHQELLLEELYHLTGTTVPTLKDEDMPIMAKEKGGDFKLLSAGTHIAICNIVADMGLQPSGYGPKHKVYFRFETPDELTEFERDGKKQMGPMSIGTYFTVSLSKKASLREFLESWRGRQFSKEELNGFDLMNVLGVACQINVVHETADNGNTYANIKAIMPLPKGMQKPAPANPLMKYSPDEPKDYERLPEWLRKKIDEQISPTPEDKQSSSSTNSDFSDDDIPF